MADLPGESDCDEHDKLNKLLKAHGIQIEDNMALNYKRDLCEVIKMSESTHLEEVKKRQSYGVIDDVVDEISEDDKNSNDIDSDATQDIGLPHSKAIEKTEFREQMEKLDSRGCSIFAVKKPRSKSPDLIVLKEIKKTPVKAPSNITSYSKSVEQPTSAHRQSRLLLLYPNKSSDGSNDGADISDKTEIDILGESDEILTVPKKKGESPPTRVEVEDTVRNIDVWNCEEDPNEVQLVDKRPDRNHSKPFYMVPPGMNLEDYLVYFGNHIDTYAAKLRANQLRSLDFVPWGPPIGVGKNCQKTSFLFDDKEDENEQVPNSSQNERYNFRGRRSPKKRPNDSYQIAETSSDEDFFTKKVRRDSQDISGPSSSSKPTPELPFNDFILSPTEVPLEMENTGSEKAAVANGGKQAGKATAGKGRGTLQRKTKHLASKAEATSSTLFEMEIESDEDYEPSGKDITQPRSRLPRPTGNARKRLAKPSVVPPKLVDDADNDAEKPPEGWLNSKNSIVIKPGPISKSVRIPKSNSVPTKRKRGKVQQLDEEQIVAELEGGEKEVDFDAVSKIPCPICSQLFLPLDIGAHADNCCESSQTLENINVDDNFNADDNINIDDNIRMMECPICRQEFVVGPELMEHSEQCVSARQKRRVPPPTHGYKR